MHFYLLGWYAFHKLRLLFTKGDIIILAEYFPLYVTHSFILKQTKSLSFF